LHVVFCYQNISDIPKKNTTVTQTVPKVGFSITLKARPVKDNVAQWLNIGLNNVPIVAIPDYCHAVGAF